MMDKHQNLLTHVNEAHNITISIGIQQNSAYNCGNLIIEWNLFAFEFGIQIDIVNTDNNEKRIADNKAARFRGVFASNS